MFTEPVYVSPNAVLRETVADVAAVVKVLPGVLIMGVAGWLADAVLPEIVTFGGEVGLAEDVQQMFSPAQVKHTYIHY